MSTVLSVLCLWTRGASQAEQSYSLGLALGRPKPFPSVFLALARLANIPLFIQFHASLICVSNSE